MAKEVQLALDLQRMDRQLSQLEAEIRGLPKKIAEMEKQLETHQRRLEVDQEMLSTKKSEVKRLENAGEDVRLKLAKLKQQVMQSTKPEQLTAFQHEITYCETEIAKNEATVLRLSTESEGQSQKVREAETRLEAEKASVEQRKVDAATQSELDRKKGTRIYREREKFAKEMPPTLLKDYERIRKKHKGGIVVAECTEGLCTACMMNIRAALLQQIRQNPEKMFFCESCMRILSYNPPRSIEGIPSSAQLSS